MKTFGFLLKEGIWLVWGFFFSSLTENICKFGLLPWWKQSSIFNLMAP